MNSRGQMKGAEGRGKQKKKVRESQGQNSIYLTPFFLFRIKSLQGSEKETGEILDRIFGSERSL